MIREEYLQDAIKQHLFGLRALRDIATILQTGVNGRVSHMLSLERIKILVENALERVTLLSRGFISGIKLDNEFVTQDTKNCELSTALLGAEVETKITDLCFQFLKVNNVVPVGERGTIFDECVKISDSAINYADTLAKIIADIIAKQNQGKMIGFSETLLDTFGQIVTDYSAVCVRLSKKESAVVVSREGLVLKLKVILSESVDYGNQTLRFWLSQNADDLILTFKRLADSAAGGVLKGNLAPLTYDLAYRYCLLGKNV